MADSRVNILMVDDQPARLLSYEAILAEAGENLIQATTASEALRVLLETDVAVVLMSAEMADCDGVKLADAIRQHPSSQRPAMIVFDGAHLTDADRIQGYRSGVTDYLSTPVVPEMLRAKVGMIVERHRKTRQLEALNSDLERLVSERTEELRLYGEEYRTRAELLDLATEAIMVRNLHGGIEFWNSGAEALYGWSRDEMIGRNVHAMLHTSFPIPQEEIAKTLRKEKSWHGNLHQTTRAGNEIVVACRKTMNHEGNAVLEVSRDITQQLRAEEALRESEKLAAMGRVAGIIAHEINNPLAAITNTLYLVRNHPSLDDTARHFADIAEQELQRVSHITRQTLSFYRESKQPIPVNVTELLDDVFGLQERALVASHILLRKRYLAAPVVQGFPVELRQVFLNLIGNAAQAMPSGGTLTVAVKEAMDWRRQRRGVSISILDTGVGISPEDAQRLFQPFFSTKSTKGTGLGLWISKGIVQKYDGTLTCRSMRTERGSGTCFRVFLPTAGGLKGAQNAVPGEEPVRTGGELNGSPIAVIHSA